MRSLLLKISTNFNKNIRKIIDSTNFKLIELEN